MMIQVRSTLNHTIKIDEANKLKSKDKKKKN